MDEHDEITFLIDEQQEQRVKCRGRFPRLIVFVFSLSVAALTANYFFHFFELPFTAPIPIPAAVVRTDREPVVSYLSGGTRESVKKDVLLLMQEGREELSRIEAELKGMERDRSAFLESMHRRGELFNENVALEGNDAVDRDLESSFILQKITLHFRDEAERRVSTYQRIYDKKRERLQARKQSAYRKLEELSTYMRSLEEKQQLAGYQADEAIFTVRAGGKLSERLLFLVRREEYGKALKVYELMNRGKQKTQTAELVASLLRNLDDLQGRLSLYEHSSLFDDIKMSYLAENYQKTISHIESDEYLKPVLQDLQGVLYRNIEAKERIAEEIELKKKLKDLRKKAVELQKRGEYEKALKIYEDLLIMNLPPYDREMLIADMHSLIEIAVRVQIKREDNTRATKYLLSARELYRERREKEAYEMYLRIVTECANSDYVEEAVSAMLEIAAR